MKYNPDDKVFAPIKGQMIAGRVLKSAWTSKGDYELVWLRIAVENKLAGGMLVSDLEMPIQSYKLRKRGTIIPELGEKEEMV